MNALEQETDLLSSVELSNHAFASVRDERPAGECEKFVAFMLGSSVYCISSKAVVEVVHPLPVAPLPNAPSSIAGIAAFKGDVIAVVNIKCMLGLGETNATNKSKLVILHAGAKNTQFAVPVDSMHELISVSPDAVTVDPNAAAGGVAKLVEFESNVINMIDTDILFEILEQRMTEFYCGAANGGTIKRIHAEYTQGQDMAGRNFACRN